MKTLVLASSNKGKINELQALLTPLAWRVLPQSDFAVPDAEETGSTFVENALIKARHAARIAQLPAIADDSGLCVDALGGAPGIFSARFAGSNASDADNNAKLLDALRDVPDEQRGAHFHCALVFVAHADDPTPIVCEASWQGVILKEPRGAHGFGYDPLFFLAGESCTSAQLPPDKKNVLSHRGQALRALVAKLSNPL